MSWKHGFLVSVFVFTVYTRELKDIEHTPFHKRNAEKVMIDVRDSYVKFTGVNNVIQSSVKVSANVSHISNGDPVKITWENPNAGLFDMVAIYTPPTRLIQDYLDYRYIIDTKGSGSGKGSFEEILFNMRGDYLVRYIAVDSSQNATVRASYLITVPENEPMHGNIAVTGIPGEIYVSWNSAKVEEPRVKYSPDPTLDGALFVPAETSTYTSDDLCGPRANITNPLMYQDPGFFHTAVLKGLKPGVRYYYSYGTDAAFSPTAAFVGPPRPESKVAVTTFIGYGDMGVYYPPYVGDEKGSGPVTKMMNKEVAGGNIDFVLHFGDISYARGRGYIWDQFMTHVSNVSSQVPYMVGVGNHEYDHVYGGTKDPSGVTGEGFHPDWGNYGDDGGGECGVPTLHRFKTPTNGNKVFWYSFDYGLIHVVQFSSEHDYRPGSRQFLWLAKDLSSVNRTKTPWIVVTSHRAIYTSQEQMGDHKVSLHMRMCLEELFYTHKVNLHLSGHYHSYESSCSVVSGDCVEPGRGTVYIVVGTAGKSLDPQMYSRYPWSTYQSCDKYGYERVTANTTHMHIEFVTVPNSIVFDDITVPKWEASFGHGYKVK